MGRRNWLRDLVVADLARNGPAADDTGKAMQVLCQRVGHHSSMSVGNVVRLLESEGAATRVIARDGQAPRGAGGHPSPHARRTYRIELTDAFIATLSVTEDPAATGAASLEEDNELVALRRGPSQLAPAISPGAQTAAAEGPDYDLLSHAILKVVFNNLSAAEDVTKLRGTRQELAEAKAALAKARAVIDGLRVDLERERKHRGAVEREAKQLSLEVDALRAELRAERARGLDTRRAGHYEVRDLVSERSQNELSKLMRSMPTARG